MSLFSGIVNTLTGGVSGDLTDVGATLAAFFGTITDGKMWRSLGWILLGIICLNWGVILLLREPIEKGVGTIAKAAVAL